MNIPKPFYYPTKHISPSFSLSFVLSFSLTLTFLFLPLFLSVPLLFPLSLPLCISLPPPTPFTACAYLSVAIHQSFVPSLFSLTACLPLMLRQRNPSQSIRRLVGTSENNTLTFRWQVVVEKKRGEAISDI